MKDERRKLAEPWNPPDRAGRTRRNARVKLIGSALIIVPMLVASAVGMIAGLGLGFGLVELDYALDVNPGVFTFVDLESVRAVLQTIATVTVSVAGLSFSVTVVALQLASQQLSPRVLRTFQGDRLAQGVLAAFVGTFVYALIVLAKLTHDGVPAISVTAAILAAVGAFGLFEQVRVTAEGNGPSPAIWSRAFELAEPGGRAWPRLCRARSTWPG
jgi:uncharacterized membrane protein